MEAAFLVGDKACQNEYLVSVLLHSELRVGWGSGTRLGICIISILVWYDSNRKPLLTSFSHHLACLSLACDVNLGGGPED